MRLPRGVHILKAHLPEGGFLLFAVDSHGIVIPHPETGDWVSPCPFGADSVALNDALWAALDTADPLRLPRPTTRRRLGLVS